MKIKYFVLGLLFLGLAFSSYLFVAYAVEEADVKYFSDVSEHHENYDAIHFLYNVDFIEGYMVENQDLREYRPNQDINRAEFLTLLLEGSNAATHAEYESCFDDVPAGEWYTTFICQAKAEGYVHGYPDGTFKPAQTINEVEVLKILGEVDDWPISVSEGQEWYQPYLDIASEANIIPDKPVDAYMSRGDIAEMIFRLIAIVTLGTDSYDKSQVAEVFDTYEVPYESNKSQGDNGGTSSDSFSADISQNGPKPADGTSKVTISVNLTDDEGSPVSGRGLEGIVMKPRNMSRLDFVDKGNGVYELDLTSYWSGTYSVYIKDKTSGDVFHTDVIFEAGAADNIEILNIWNPYETNDHSAYVIASVDDEYGNAVEDVTLNFETDLGSVDIVEYYEEYGYWVGAVSSDSYGDANITVSVHGASSISETVTVSFDTVYLGTAAGVTNGETFEVPVYVNMGSYGSLGSYEVRIMDVPGHWDFITAVDGDESDPFDEPQIAVTDNTIILSQTSNTGEVTGQYIHVANLQFEATVVGTGAIYVEDATITNTDEEQVDPDVPSAEEAPEVVVKDTKSVCLDVYTLEGSDESTYLDVSSDVSYAETIFWLAAFDCKCPYYLNFVLNHKEISAEEWKIYAEFHGTDIAVEDNVLEEDEMDEVADMIAANNDCIQIFYVPQLEVSDEQAEMDNEVTIGWSAVGGAGADYIAVDNSRDYDDATLAHELLHMLSDNDVVDGDVNASAADKAKAHAQGADQKGNLMNYNHPGIDITKNQCDLL